MAETQIKRNKTTNICKKTEIKRVTVMLYKNRDKRSESGAETCCTYVDKEKIENIYGPVQR